MKNTYLWTTIQRKLEFGGSWTWLPELPRVAGDGVSCRHLEPLAALVAAPLGGQKPARPAKFGSRSRNSGTVRDALRRPSACHLYPQTIPSSHHLTHWALVNNYSRTYSQLGILSYIFLSSLSQKYKYKSTSLIFTYEMKTVEARTSEIGLCNTRMK